METTEYKCAADHEPVFVKDMLLDRFNKKFPEFDALSARMRSLLPDGYKHYLVDFIVQDCVPGARTCRDIRWHVDGKADNKYVLWARGPNRTEFPERIPDMGGLPADRESQNVWLEGVLNEGVEIPDQHIVSYDSKTPHRGVLCRESGKRLFVRMMATNYIVPKNILKNQLPVGR